MARIEAPAPRPAEGSSRENFEVDESRTISTLLIMGVRSVGDELVAVVSRERKCVSRDPSRPLVENGARTVDENCTRACEAAF